MNWGNAYELIDAHKDELGPLAEGLQQIVKRAEGIAQKQQEAEAEARARHERNLAARRRLETEKAISLLDSGWLRVFPQLPDLIRAKLDRWCDFDTYRDLIVDFEPNSAMSDIRLIVAREPKDGEYRFTEAKLHYAGFSASAMENRRAEYEPEYTQFYAVKATDTYTELESLILSAVAARVVWNQRQEEHVAWQADEEQRRAALAADHKRQQAEAQASRLDQQADQSERSIEEERLLAWLRTDPPVANLVRAFIAIENDRQSWSERIDSADEAASNAWETCERNSARLRAQADEYRREAEAKRAEARRYEDEAEEARQKINDAERRAESCRSRRSSWDY